MFHVSPLVASPAVYHEHIIFLIHSSFYHHTRTRSTIGTTRATPRTPRTSFPQSTSCAIKNDCGVKTCTAAEKDAQQLEQVMSPKNLRLSFGSKLILEIHINEMMYRKNSENEITELRSPKKWKNLERKGQLAYRILNCQRRPTFNRTCTSTIPQKALQILISKMESYKRC